MENLILYSIPLVVLDAFFWYSSFLKRRLSNLLFHIVSFGLLNWIIFNSGITPFASPRDNSPLHYHYMVYFLTAFWWFSAAALLSLFSHLLFELNKGKNKRNRIFRDLTIALIFIFALGAYLSNVFNFSIRGLVATSGVLAVILGLAIQSSLNDVFSGIILNTTSPCEIGDWIKIDTTEGRVIDINWRATHLITLQGNIVITPNSLIAKAKITNNNRPAKLHGVSISIEVSIEERPETVFSALDNALIGISMLLQDPKPFYIIKGTSINSFQYEITAFVDEVEKKRVAINKLYDLCHRHLSSAGIGLKPLGMLFKHHNEPFDRKQKMLSYVDLFQSLKKEEVFFLSDNITTHIYGPGQVVVSPDSMLDYLLIVASGVISIEAEKGTDKLEVKRLSPGDSIGEISVIAGIEINFSAKALVSTVVYRLERSAFTSLLKAYEGTGEKMCQIISQSENILSSQENVALASGESKNNKSVLNRLLDGMHKLHQL
ncbi:mechanosensitive ion channel family protein [Serratia sp. UGAL515B_01]|uniref:mechanosensitive ion channel family protein n=1 Tax=Serratia sp. UGAL515B_01 TaxID=2986763 RepID=UPI002953E3C2|nr:mechanosensitive ion channel family protein [Serratia sp. UGAL515B_01]WON77734.1 mechanosensitive ion channel family protein [Serratia sp. UGAL515B_01]